MRTWLMLAVAVTGLGAPAYARLTPAGNRKEAAAHVKKAQQLAKDGDLAGAVLEYRAAWEAGQSFEYLLDVGLAEQQLTRWDRAAEALNRYLDEGGKKAPKDKQEKALKALAQIRDGTAAVRLRVEGPPARITLDGEVLGMTPLAPVLVGPGRHTFTAERTGEFDEEVVDLQARTEKEVVLTPKAKMVVESATVIVDSSPSGAVITIDDSLVGLSPTHAALAPGKHVLTAEVDGSPPRRIEFEVSSGEKRELLINFEAVPPSLASRTGGAGPRLLIPGIVIAGAGLALVGGGVALNVVAHDQARQVSALFEVGGTWDAQAQARQTAGLGAQTWSWVLTVGGAVLAVAGGALIVVPLLLHPASPTEETSVWLAPTVGGFAVGGTW